MVGLEPSCLLTLRDEALALGLGERAQAVSQAAWLFEEFIAREARAGRFTLPLRAAEVPDPGARPLSSEGLWRGCADARGAAAHSQRKPALIEASCCGMAGSFGYEAEHYEISMQMAEVSLLPAVRAAPDAMVVADGTSCRHQIRDGARREAMHVTRLLESHLLT